MPFSQQPRRGDSPVWTSSALLLCLRTPADGTSYLLDVVRRQGRTRQRFLEGQEGREPCGVIHGTLRHSRSSRPISRTSRGSARRRSDCMNSSRGRSAHILARLRPVPRGGWSRFSSEVGAPACDLDGHKHVEYGIGLRSVTLGHAYRPVVDGVTAAIADGVSFSRPTALEVERPPRPAWTRCPGVDMEEVRKDGSDANDCGREGRLGPPPTSSGRRRSAPCPAFFSTDDWFIGSTAMSA